ncbi:MAG: glycosyltransferase family 4 protein [Deltaproteobacteria bacterium]|nr:glycosyltransferase family 4 protein [Deltaproteobacteria bacterium]
MTLDPVRVMFVSHDPTMYGAQQSLLTLLASIDRSVCTPFLLNPKNGPLGRKAADLGIPVFVEQLVHWVPGSWVKGSRRGYLKHYFRFFGSLNERCRAIERLIAKHGIDLVYTNTVTCVEGAIAAKRSGKPHVWHIRESIPGNSELVPLLPYDLHCAAISALSESVVFCSRVLANGYPRLSGKANVVYNGFPFPFPPRDRNAARAEITGKLGIESGSKLVAIVGALHPRKDLHTFLDAAVQVARGMRDAVFLIAGAGSEQYTDTVRRRIGELKLDSKVRLLGWRDDIDEMLGAIDVLVISSEQESFGRTMIEALAMETPVVSTRCGGPEEVLTDGETGFLVPVKDPSAMADAIGKLLADPRLSRRMGMNGRSHVSASFGIDRYVEGIQRVIRKSAGARATSPGAVAAE